MNGGGDRERPVYRGVWAVLAGLFKVPHQPPTLLALGGEEIDSFRPARGFLDYLRFHFWVVLALVDGGLLVLWMTLLARSPLAGLSTAPLFFLLIVVPDVVAWIAVQLRYDTTWYVMSGRSVRIRRGIWVIRETTATFENVQNVELKQGPLQRYFGIADLVIQTAGGGGAKDEKGETNPHLALIEGVSDAERIRDVIMTKVRRSRRSGLGDEHDDDAHHAPSGWSAEHVEVLRAIRDEVRGLAG